MSLPERPGASPTYNPRNAYRNSQSRRSRPVDIETGGYHAVDNLASHQRGKSGSSFAESIGINSNTESMPLSPTSPDGQPRHAGPEQPISRKRSLIRPERNRIDRDHRNYHYHKHAAHMNVLPSSTGNDPIYEDFEASTERSNSNYNDGGSDGSPRQRRTVSGDHEKSAAVASAVPTPDRTKSGKIKRRSKRHSKPPKRIEEQLRPPTFWNVYCAIVTFWAPGFIMKCCGMPTRAQQRAWREKMGLISIIFVIMAIVGFLTFGFTAVVCGAPQERLRVNKVDGGNMIFHGVAYDLSKSHHPPADVRE
jgi:chitin synthase